MCSLNSDWKIYKYKLKIFKGFFVNREFWVNVKFLKVKSGILSIDVRKALIYVFFRF